MIRRILSKTIAVVLLIVPSVVCAQQAGNIAAIQYVNGEAGSTFEPGDTLLVTTVVDIKNNTDDDDMYFWLQIEWDPPKPLEPNGPSHGTPIDTATLDSGDVDTLSGSDSYESAPNVEVITATIRVYYLQNVYGGEPQPQILKERVMVFNRKETGGGKKDLPVVIGGISP